jgi:methyl halide transferase
MRLLESWDADYRGQRPPPWDISRPSDELQKAVNAGTIRSSRVVDLCCGSGTDAVYLASHGFDVTAIDIAPTALVQARQKALKAAVSVRWILGDVLAPPDLGTFDFIYDRGCYHVVRDQNLSAYLDTLRRLSHPGTRLLLLAARREEQASPGSPGVTEEELRYDFLSLFDVEWLRKSALESNRGTSPPGWSVLLRRKPAP